MPGQLLPPPRTYNATPIAPSSSAAAPVPHADSWTSATDGRPHDHRGQRLSPILQRFDDSTTYAEQVQASLLRSILRQNVGCEYLRQFPSIAELCDDSSSCSNSENSEKLVAAFRRSVPLVTHADIKPYIDRIADGGRAASSNVLTAAPVEALCLSSGTTDAKQKYLLYHEGLSSGTLEVASIAAAFREKVYPLEKAGMARIAEFLFSGKLVKSKGGLPAGTASTHMIQGEAFKRRQQKNGLRPCSPDAVASSCEYKEAMYCHLLSSLVYSQQVQVLSAPFAFTLLEALRTLETLWPRLCADIAAGALRQTEEEEAVTNARLRSCMEEEVLVSPDPDLAARLVSTFRKLAATDWHGAVAVLWPHCKYVLSIFTGAMEPYAQQLQRRYLGGVGAPPLVCADYGATEGWIGINIDPTSPPSHVRYTIPPSLAFFEFIPLTRRLSVESTPGAAAYEEGEAVGMCDVEVGREYELVMTTAWGLYRYRVGDIVRVTGFYNRAPQVAYVCRKNVMLSLSIDKVTEKDLEVAVEKAGKHLSEATEGELELADYSSYADRSTTPGHYVVFWEVGGKDGGNCNGSSTTYNAAAASRMLMKSSRSTAALEECAEALEAALRTEPGYATARKMGSIGPLELRVVQSGSFARRLLGMALARGSAISQYKTPRCLVSPEAQQLLHSATVATFFSGAHL